jgi:hypothetical protein
LRAPLVIVSLLLGACQNTDALVVVTVSADPTISNVASLDATMTVGAVTHLHNMIPVTGGTLPSAPPTTFGVLVAASLGSSMTIQISAVDASGSAIASGQTTASLVAGKRTDAMVTLLHICAFDDPNSKFDQGCVFGP